MSETDGGPPPDDNGLVALALRKKLREGWGRQRLADWLYVSYNTVRSWDRDEWTRIEEPTRQKLMWRFGYLESEPEVVTEAREAREEEDQAG